MSISQILLLANWFFEGKLKEKWNMIKQNRSLLLFCSIYMIHIIGMFYTSDLEWGFHDLRVKLPLLVVPIIIATSEPVNAFDIKRIMHVFMGAVFISTLASTAIYLNITPFKWNDIREVSIFISHIRLSLLIVISIFTAIYYFVRENAIKLKTGYILLIVWLIYFLTIMQMLTGLVVLLITFLVLWIVFYKKLNNRAFRISTWITVILLPVALGGYSFFVLKSFIWKKPIPSSLPACTINGNPYSYDFTDNMVENGNAVYMYISEFEMRKEWNLKSRFPYDSLDQKGQEIKYTLIRYLASKNLTRDSLGINQLTQKDVENIERGMANYIYAQHGIFPRLYIVVWEFYRYSNQSNLNGHSVTQRIAFVKNAIEIIKQNFWFGVGTGDIRKNTILQYQKGSSQVTKEFQKRAHNQYVTFFTTFGFVFFMVIMAAFFITPYWEKRYSNYFFLMTLCVSMISFFNEDTLETLPGVLFVTFFFSLFLFGQKNDQFEKNHQP
jgi:O-antigen ligase